MRFGFHVSISGSMIKAVERAEERKCETAQIFSRNPRGWSFNELPGEEVRAFRNELHRTGISPLIVHLPYLPNLAAGDTDLYERSVESLEEDLRRAEMLRAACVVMHPGRRGGLSIKEAFDKVIEGIDKALRTVNNGVKLLLENTAGQGSEMCHRFSDLAVIMGQFKRQNRLGVCLDTAHAFAAGYDLSQKRRVDEALDEFDKLIGLDRLHLIHLNDSRTPFNSRVDRHENIGKGFIGTDGFGAILRHPLLSYLPFIMETPWTGLKNDLRNMRAVRKILQEKGQNK
jgi:deoxyribonuclease-4